MHVVKDGELQRYLMFYEAAAADGTRSIGLAASQDGISGWERLDRCARSSGPSTDRSESPVAVFISASREFQLACARSPFSRRCEIPTRVMRSPGGSVIPHLLIFTEEKRWHHLR